MSATGQAFSVSVGPDGAFLPTGELDLSNLQELRDLVAEAMAPGRAVVLDLAHLTFMDSSVIHWLVETWDSTGHPVVLRNASPVVRRILDVTANLGPDGHAWVFEPSDPTGTPAGYEQASA
jgi:anti-anti-sigma factor